jgi:hypothetical protein
MNYGLGYSPFDLTNLAAIAAITSARGWESSGAIWENVSLRQFINDWRDDWGADIYFDTAGKIIIHLDAAYSATSPNHYKDSLDIIGAYASKPTADTHIVNYLRGGYNYHYSKNYFRNYRTDQDTYSQTKYNAKYQRYKSFNQIRDSTTAIDVIARRLMRFADPPVFEKFTLPLKSFSDALTDEIRITDFRGTGTAGYDGSDFVLRSQNFDLDNYTNDILAEYVDPLAGNGFILGDGTILPAAWTGATLAQKRYGYLCDGTADTFSDGMPGKKLAD